MKERGCSFELERTGFDHYDGFDEFDEDVSMEICVFEGLEVLVEGIVRLSEQRRAVEFGIKRGSRSDATGQSRRCRS